MLISRFTKFFVVSYQTFRCYSSTIEILPNKLISGECSFQQISLECGENTNTYPTYNDESYDASSLQCSLYLATSSIPDSGFGIYTTRDIKAGHMIKHYADAPSIVVVDPDLQGGDDLITAHENYFWDSEGYSGFEADAVSELLVNLGSLTNYHPYLKNIDVRILSFFLYSNGKYSGLVHYFYSFLSFLIAIIFCYL